MVIVKKPEAILEAISQSEYHQHVLTTRFSIGAQGIPSVGSRANLNEHPQTHATIEMENTPAYCISGVLGTYSRIHLQ